MFDFRLTSEQEQIVGALSSYLRKEGGDGGPAGGAGITVRDIAALGWIGIAAPEEAGGAGQSLIEESLIAREFGRSLVTPAALFLQLAMHTACAAGAVELAASLASAESAAGAAIGLARTRPAGEDGIYLLHCERPSYFWTVDGQQALLVQVTAGSEPAACHATDPGLCISRIASARIHRHLVHIDTDGALTRRAQVLIAAMLAGLAEATRDLAVQYAKERRQFGRVIGSFQAVKHRCADMHVRARMCAAQVMLAAMSEAARLQDHAHEAQAALIVAVEAAIRNAEACIQVYGGLGFSEESIAHRYLKRAHLLRIWAESCEVHSS